MLRKILLSIFVLSFIINHLYSQDKIKFFSSPIDLPLFLAGNFGELRTSHFHGGIDIKTQQEEGKLIIAPADGFISRINIAPNGYGNALYINHYGKYLSVYGHLRNFRKDIDRFTMNNQYDKQSFVIDFNVDSTLFPVRKGDTIAFSGNTGSSTGPHLHFEIRNAEGTKQINPQLFDFVLYDEIKPIISELYVYPLSKNSRINNEYKKTRIKIKKTNNAYVITDPKELQLTGDIGFGIVSYDRLSGETNKCGDYSTQLLIDNQLIYQFKLDSVAIADTRYILSYIDFQERAISQREIQKLFIEPNNQLENFPTLINRGIYCFNDDSIHDVKIIVDDISSNSSVLQFSVKSKKVTEFQKDTIKFTCDAIIPFDHEYNFVNDEISVSFPENALYDTLKFIYSKTDPKFGSLSPIYHIHNRYTALHKPITISILAETIPEKIRDKVLIASVNQSERKVNLNSAGGIWKDGKVTTNVKEFGNYTLVADTVAPTVKPVNFKRGKNMSSEKNIKFLISDNFSGIASYNGFIDDKWVLFRYDEKNKTISYRFTDNKLEKGKTHKLELIVKDNKNNETRYIAAFDW